MEDCYIFALRRRHLYLSLIIDPVVVRTNTLATRTQPEDPRFNIKIIGPQDETAKFKTRGEHPVRKVLAAACKAFDIKYERCVVVIFLQFMFFYTLSSTLELVSSCVFQRRRKAKISQMNLTVQWRIRCLGVE
jgi:hypothetical protein